MDILPLEMTTGCDTGYRICIENTLPQDVTISFFTVNDDEIEVLTVPRYTTLIHTLPVPLGTVVRVTSGDEIAYISCYVHMRSFIDRDGIVRFSLDCCPCPCDEEKSP